MICFRLPNNAAGFINLIRSWFRYCSQVHPRGNIGVEGVVAGKDRYAEAHEFILVLEKHVAALEAEFFTFPVEGYDNTLLDRTAMSELYKGGANGLQRVYRLKNNPCRPCLTRSNP
jgi:hypothetical protein